jgi:amino acid adenylation domain-containing protein
VSTLQDRILDAFDRYPERTALVTGEGRVSFAELSEQAGRIAGYLVSSSFSGGPGLLAVFGDHAADTYAAILGAVIAGWGYVPLSPGFPPERCRFMLDDSGARTVFVAIRNLSSFDPFLRVLSPGMSVVAEALPPSWVEQAPGVSFRAAAGLPPGPGRSTMPVAASDQCVYVLYTSGSTGVPKGVKVSHGNLGHFVETVTARYSFGPEDRFSQTFDLTFDLSTLALFAGLGAGAAVHPLGTADKLSPVRFVRQHELTVWYSVPSLVLQIRKLRQLRAGVMPSLRVSLFCGEPLPVASADGWRAAAPRSLVENHYGPTEATVACSCLTWDETAAARRHRNGVVPIGLPMPGVRFAVRGEDGGFLPAGSEGELCIAGAQVCLGYTDYARTAHSFFVAEDPRTGIGERWYRTGDRAAFDSEERAYVWLGRMDHQVKIRGYRVELGEVESVLRSAYGLDAVVVIPHPVVEGTAEGLVAFLERYPGHPEPDILREVCRARLPEYMWPADYYVLETLPLTPNGKHDRKALARRLGR